MDVACDSRVRTCWVINHIYVQLRLNTLAIFELLNVFVLQVIVSFVRQPFHSSLTLQQVARLNETKNSEQNLTQLLFKNFLLRVETYGTLVAKPSVTKVQRMASARLHLYALWSTLSSSGPIISIPHSSLKSAQRHIYTNMNKIELI